MFDILAALALLKPVFEIKDGINVLVGKLPFFGRKVWQQGSPSSSRKRLYST